MRLRTPAQSGADAGLCAVAQGAQIEPGSRGCCAAGAQLGAERRGAPGAYTAPVGTAVRLVVEAGKKKRTVVVAIDWPGWVRSGRTAEEALGVLDAYRPRYATVAGIAGLGDELAAADAYEIVDRIPGAGLTDYYGMSGAWAELEKATMTKAECERLLDLLAASWTLFDRVAGRVSADLRKGPRGGGRDRDLIIRHVMATEIELFAPKVGVKVPADRWRNPEDLSAYRADMRAAIGDYNARGALAGPVAKWPIRYLIRHAASHMLDHAWELEDRDLS